MNNKKKVIGIVVLVAILAIGIGYAAITNYTFENLWYCRCNN